MSKKIKDLLDFDFPPETLPFNYQKWVVENNKEKSKHLKICHSKDYMTTKYELIPFYKPILMLGAQE